MLEELRRRLRRPAEERGPVLVEYSSLVLLLAIAAVALMSHLSVAPH